MGHHEGKAVGTLFRPEVLAARNTQWMGEIRLAQPASRSVVTLVALLISVAVIAFAALGSVAKKARVGGITVPVDGSIPVVATAGGVLVKSLVTEGKAVEAGQPLFEISTERFGERGEVSALVAQQLATRLTSLETERHLQTMQEAEKKVALERQIESAAAEQVQVEHEINLLQRRQALAQESVEKYEKLQRAGYVSEAQVQQKQEEVIDIATRLSTLQRSKLQLQANRSSLDGDRSSLGNIYAIERAQIERSIAGVRQEIAENSNRKTSFVRSIHAGTVTTLTSRTGQSVATGQVLATIIPYHSDRSRAQQDGQLEVHLYAPSRTAGFVERGQEVLIRYQAYPYQKFGLHKGTVIDVSTTPFALSELPSNMAGSIVGTAQLSKPSANGGEALYRIKVRIARQAIDAYGRQYQLKPGLTVEADVLQHSRRVWEWVAEPLLSMRQRI